MNTKRVNLPYSVPSCITVLLKSSICLSYLSHPPKGRNSVCAHCKRSERHDIALIISEKCPFLLSIIRLIQPRVAIGNACAHCTRSERAAHYPRSSKICDLCSRWDKISIQKHSDHEENMNGEFRSSPWWDWWWPGGLEELGQVAFGESLLMSRRLWWRRWMRGERVLC